MLLESQGYEVLTAAIGRERLALFASHSIRVVMLDFAMPEVDGAEVAASLKRLDPAVKSAVLCLRESSGKGIALG